MQAVLIAVVVLQELGSLSQGIRRLQERVAQQENAIRQHEKRLVEVVQVGSWVCGWCGWWRWGTTTRRLAKGGLGACNSITEGHRQHLQHEKQLVELVQVGSWVCGWVVWVVQMERIQKEACKGGWGNCIPEGVRQHCQHEKWLVQVVQVGSWCGWVEKGSSKKA